MSEYAKSGYRQEQTTSALTPYRVVKKSASTGYVSHAGAGDIPYGTVESLVNSSTDPRGVAVRLFNDVGTRLMVASGVIPVFGRVYVAASGKITATPTGYCVGIALQAATADLDEIEVLTGASEMFSEGLIYKTVADGTAYHTSTTETAQQALTIPANTIRDGDTFTFEAVVSVTSVNATPTLRYRVRFGPTTLTGTIVADNLSAAAPAVIAGDKLILRGKIQIRTSGASGTFVAEAIGISNETAPVVEMTSIAVTSTAIDTTADLLIEPTLLWSASHASNSAKQISFNVRKN